MFAIIAAILFGVALLLDLLDTATEVVATLTLAGLLAVALHLALGIGLPAGWRRNP